MSQTSTIPNILYVDDDSDDCIFLTESFAATSVSTKMVCASSGDEAISYLDAARDNLPSLIILDLNMPGRDGKQTLHYIKSSPRLSGIPVVILSTSQSMMDKEVCTRLGAASYLEKPHHYDGYKDVVQKCLPLIKGAGQTA